MIAQTIKLVAKIRDNHKRYLESREKHILRQIFVLLPKAVESLNELSKANTPYKWRDRFVFLSMDFINEFKAAYDPKLKSTHLYETGESLDKALDWLFKNIPELRK
jgi:hypothetical protein